MKTTTVCIHCKPEILDHWMIKDGNLFYYNNLATTGEIDVMVADISQDYCDGVYQDPDEALCEEYSIPYDLVNCIELA